jgi:hypothetical protein
VGLYVDRRVSLGRGAEIAGISKPEFLDALGERRLSIMMWGIWRRTFRQLLAIWGELPEEWTETETGLTLGVVESLLWQFEENSDKFWTNR